jgi:hypothetical protein
MQLAFKFGRTANEFMSGELPSDPRHESADGGPCVLAGIG